MILRSAARRLAVTLPFFTIAALVLGFLGDPAIPESPLSTDAAPMVLVVTTQELHQPFQALEAWNQERGCAVKVVTLEGFDRESPADTEVDLAAVCREVGATGLLLGGSKTLLPLFPEGSFSIRHGGLESTGSPKIVPIPADGETAILRGVPVGRVPVGDVTEAWAFVEACRTSGQTLDHLIDAVGLGDVALAVP